MTKIVLIATLKVKEKFADFRLFLEKRGLKIVEYAENNKLGSISICINDFTFNGLCCINQKKNELPDKGKRN